MTHEGEGGVGVDGRKLRYHELRNHRHHLQQQQCDCNQQPPLQRAMFRLSFALGAASALVAPGRCSARVLQHHALLGTMLSQRSLARVALQDKRFLGSERLQLLCCGSPLSALLIRLAAVVDRSGRSSAEHRYIVCTVKRYFSGVAHRFWHKRR
jgi:hypothetical protein